MAKMDQKLMPQSHITTQKVQVCIMTQTGVRPSFGDSNECIETSITTNMTKVKVHWY